MGNPVSPEKRRFRPFLIVSIVALFLVYLIALTWVLLWTRDAVLAAPLLVAVVAFKPMVNQVIVWLSTPEECKQFTADKGNDPLVGLIRELITSRVAAPPKRKKPDSTAPPKNG